MPILTNHQRIARLEERQEALERAFRALLFADYVRAQDESRDGLASDGQSALAPDEYVLAAAEETNDASARARRIMDRAPWLLDPSACDDGPTGA